MVPFRRHTNNRHVLAIAMHCAPMNLTIRVNPPSIYRIMGRQENIDLDKEKIRAFCEVNGIQRLSLFGSVLTDRFGPESDVDVLIDFLPGSVPGFFRLAAIEADLAQLFGRAPMANPPISRAGSSNCTRESPPAPRPHP